jgi:hypothetical protein
VTQPRESGGIADAGFELGSPNPHWAESSTHFGTPICNTACGLSAYSGNNYAWFGGVADTLEVATLEQAVVISADMSTLSFYLLIGSNAGRGELTVWLDDTKLTAFSAADLDHYAAYTNVSLPISQFADGNSHTLRFYGVTYPGGTTNFLVDELSLTTAPPLAVSLTEAVVTTIQPIPILLATIALTILTLILISQKGAARWNV